MTNSALLKIAAKKEQLAKVRHNTTGGTWKKSEVIAKIRKKAKAHQQALSYTDNVYQCAKKHTQRVSQG